MPITVEQLLKAAPNTKNAKVVASALNYAMEQYGIDTVLRMAHFLGQAAHESDDFSRTRENLNYSANGLVRTWPKRFKTFVEAQYYERQPEKIANFVYGNRMGNGDAKSGDGYKFRGAGWFQITGRSNHQEAAQALGQNLNQLGDFLDSINGSALSAAWFFWKCGAIRYADMNNCDAVSDLVNIGHRTEQERDAIGYEKRLFRTKKFIEVLSNV